MYYSNGFDLGQSGDLGLRPAIIGIGIYPIDKQADVSVEMQAQRIVELCHTVETNFYVFLDLDLRNAGIDWIDYRKTEMDRLYVGQKH